MAGGRVELDQRHLVVVEHLRQEPARTERVAATRYEYAWRVSWWTTKYCFGRIHNQNDSEVCMRRASLLMNLADSTMGIGSAGVVAT